MECLICLLFFLPLITGVAVSTAAVRPIGRLAGWLIAFPIVNLLGVIVIGWLAQDLSRWFSNDWNVFSAFGVILLCWLAIRFKSDWQAGELNHGIWLSLGFIAIHWALIPWVPVSLAYLVELHSGLTRDEMAFAAQYAVPISVLFFALPVLNTLFTLWMLRRDARLHSST